MNKIENKTDIKKFLIPDKYLKKWFIENVIITGGEPLLVYDKILEILDYYNEKVKNIELITNGLILNEKVISELEKFGLKTMNISCDGLDDNTQYALRKTKPDVIWNKISLVKKHTETKLILHLLYTLTKINNSLFDLNGFIKKALELNVDGIKFQPVTADLDEKIKDLVIPADNLSSLLNYLQNIAKMSKIINTSDFFEISKMLMQNKNNNIIPFRCSIPECNIFINSEGVLLKCPILNPNLPNSKYKSIDDVNFPKIECQLKDHCLCMF